MPFLKKKGLNFIGLKVRRQIQFFFHILYNLIHLINSDHLFFINDLLILGTGYGTGSTQQSWNVEQALMKQKSEEEHVTILLQVLASYINPNGEAADGLAGEVLPPTFHDLLLNSCLLPVLSSYLRNDSGNVLYLYFKLI